MKTKIKAKIAKTLKAAVRAAAKARKGQNSKLVIKWRELSILQLQSSCRDEGMIVTKPAYL